MDVSSYTGVEILKIFFRLPKVLVLALASSTGEPSPSRSNGMASSSSKNKYLIGEDLRAMALFPPVAINTPPGKLFNILVFSESLCFFSPILSLSLGGLINHWLQSSLHISLSSRIRRHDHHARPWGMIYYIA